jgi:2-oxoglutarate ferredoxin oxidoreductase subunit alpha
VGDQIFTDGNSAAALGCIYGGATVAAWYPITPSSSVPEAFQKYCDKYRVDPATGQHNYAIVQAEDELASIGMVVGAGWNGARAFTATSGPGVSLMTEFIGLAYFAEIPVTIINVQRGGPSTGMPTRTQQSDLLSCAYASHGDTKHVLLFPQDPHECFEHSGCCTGPGRPAADPDLRHDRPRHRHEPAPVQAICWDDSRDYDRGKVMTAEELEAGKDFGRYKDVDGDGIPWRTLPGTHPTKGSFFHPGHHPQPLCAVFRARPRLHLQHGAPAAQVPHRRRPGAATRAARGDPTDALMASFISAPPARPCVRRWTCWKPTACIWTPCVFAPSRSRLGASSLRRTRRFSWWSKTVMRRCAPAGQRARSDPARLVPVLHYDGTPITARFIVQAIRDNIQPASANASAPARQKETA